MRWVGLVRNVMIGREGLHRDVLLGLLADSGGANGRSHLATGNLTFTAPARDIGRVTRQLEAGIADVIGRTEPVIMRRLDWLASFVADDPFADFDPESWELLVALLPTTARPVDPARIPDSRGTVVVSVRDRELLTARPRTVPPSPHGNMLMERASGVKSTSRGWSTLLRLATKGYDDSAG